MKRLTRLLIIIFAVLPALFIFAEDGDDADEIIIFAEDLIIIEDVEVAGDTAVSPGHLTVFTREDIEASGARTASELIERVAGVVVSRTGGILEPVSISIRGGSDSHVLILIDGKTAASVWDGEADAGQVAIQDIERIEIIKGPAAALYGGGAVSGVINIIRRKDGGTEFSADAEYGFASFNTHSLAAGIAGSIPVFENCSGSMRVNGLYTGGDYSYAAGSGLSSSRINNDGFSAGLSASAEAGEDGSNVSVSANLAGSERGTPGLMEFLTPAARLARMGGELSFDMMLETGSAGRFDGGGSAEYRWSRYTDSGRNMDESNAMFAVGTNGSWTSEVDLSDIFAELRVSAGWKWSLLDSTALTDNTGMAVQGQADQHSGYLRFSASSSAGQIDFNPAVSGEFAVNNYAGTPGRFDASFCWLAAFGWSPMRTETEEGPLYFKLNAGSGFKNPSFQDLFWPAGALAAGNPDLKAEHSLSFDGGIGLIFEDPAVSIDAAGYYGITEDLIQWLPAAGGIWRPRNIGKVVNTGVEVSSSWRIDIDSELSAVEVYAAYSWMRAVDAVDGSVNFGRQLAYRPEHSADGSLRLEFGGIAVLDFSCRYIGSRFTNNANTKTLDQALILSLSAVWTVLEGFEITAAADNITNQAYVDRLGYPVPGFEYSLKGRVEL